MLSELIRIRKCRYPGFVKYRVLLLGFFWSLHAAFLMSSPVKVNPYPVVKLDPYLLVDSYDM